MRLLERDRELAEDLDPKRLRSATEQVHTPTITVPTGGWKPPAWPASVCAGAGLLLLEGLMLRRVGVDGRFGAELLSAGDLLRPWQPDGTEGSFPRRLRWSALEPCRFAVLDVDLMRRLADYPEVYGRLVARALRRSRHLAVNIAIVHQPRVEARLHMLLWHFADRWGIVRVDGVMMPVNLTHETLAELIAARRPTVSSALAGLERAGLLRRTREGWLLRGGPPGELDDVIEERTGAPV